MGLDLQMAEEHVEHQAFGCLLPERSPVPCVVAERLVVVKVPELAVDNIPNVDVLGFEKLGTLRDGGWCRFVREQILAKALEVLQLVVFGVHLLDNKLMELGPFA